MPQPRSHARAAPADSAVLTKAVLRAADQLGVTSRALSGIIGVSEATVSRMRKDGFLLERGSKPFELGVLFVRLFRSLDAIAGGDETVSKAWIRNENHSLGARPLDRILTIAGLLDVISYLDTRRAIV